MDEEKKTEQRSGRLWAAGCLTVVLCAGIIFYGYRMARAPQERESQDTAQEENAAQAGNTTNVEAQVKDNPDAKDETGNGKVETGAGDTASVDGQTSADGTSGMAPVPMQPTPEALEVRRQIWQPLRNGRRHHQQYCRFRRRQPGKIYRRYFCTGQYASGMGTGRTVRQSEPATGSGDSTGKIWKIQCGFHPYR